MKALDKEQYEYIDKTTKKLHHKIEFAQNKGELQYFNDTFFSCFDGYCYNGVPVKYMVKEYKENGCFDQTIALALALKAYDPKENIYICLANLRGRPVAWGHEGIPHIWIEHKGIVLDVTIGAKLTTYAMNRIYSPVFAEKQLVEDFVKENNINTQFPYGLHKTEEYDNLPPELMPKVVYVNYSKLIDTTNKTTDSTEKFIANKYINMFPKIDRQYMEKVMPDTDDIM